ncbi:MAG: 2Fe-2S iron-sulfur cluster binding domain-containing protein [Chlorobi bacterium]|nr:2Fe-2S iron-sulfur cluster binding domain-containing protein [Chlorobiota bacterium]
MLEFILNNKLIKTQKSASSILLDFIRYDQHLKGTKSGCREGDCGACTVLVGTLENGKVNYKSVASCLTPLGNVAGKHVVTVEGLNAEKELTPIQHALDEHAGTQCGFCTPGFVVSLTGHALSKDFGKYDEAISSVSGNICRCTGYKSIERATKDIAEGLKATKENSLDWLIENKYLPDYFSDIASRLADIDLDKLPKGKKIIGGGTDLYVQKMDETSEVDASFVLSYEKLKGISENDGIITVGAATTANEIMHSDIFNKYFPKIKTWFKLISSEQIRNVGTIAGNFVNASPIGDLSIFFLALNSELVIKDSRDNERTVALKDFFKDYKKVDLQEGEIIKELKFVVPKENFKFNFEKVSKRTYLDIASVNTAVSYTLAKNVIEDIHISGGGLAATPVYFNKTREFLKGKELNEANLQQASDVLLTEVTPMSDIRGSKEYKSLLLKQLFFAHFEE